MSLFAFSCGSNNKSVQLASLKFQLCFTVLEFLRWELLCTTTTLSPPGSADRMTKQQKEAEVNQTSLCLSACLSAYLYVCSTCLCASDWPISRLSLCLTVSADLTLSPRLSPCNLTCPMSRVFFRAWLAGWLADWLTFGLIRVTYRRATGTHKHMRAHTNINAQAAYSSDQNPWPEPLTIHSSAPQSCECVRHAV